MKKSVKVLSLILALVMTFAVFTVGVNAEDAACEHTYGDWSVLVQPKCESEGKQTRACTKCLGIDEEVIPATGHTYGEEPIETVDATCKNEGYKGYKCLNCDFVEKRDVKEALPHAYGEPTVTSATCTTPGTSTKVCTVCLTPDTTVLPILGHKAGEETFIKSATCLVDGYKYKLCKVCNTEIKVENGEIKAEGHKYADVVTEPTCTEKGYTTHTCTLNCGEEGAVVVDTDVDALGHTYGAWTEVSAPNCTDKGLKERICTVCDENTEGYKQTEEIPALGHKYEAVITEPTYTSGGYTTHTCVSCDDSYIDSETEMLPDKIKEIRFVAQDGSGEHTTGTWYVINYQKSYNITPVIYTERGEKISVDSEMVKSIVYISSDEKIATIDNETGIVTGMGTGTLNSIPEERWANVECVVTDVDGNEYKATCHIQVDFSILDWIKLIFDILKVAIEVVVGGIIKGFM